MLTILIFSYARQDYLKRQFRFWSEYPDINLMVQDGSITPIEEGVIEQLPSNIEYIHNPVGLYERLNALVKSCETPYACLLSDDEFFTPSVLNRCVSFLQKNPNYSTAGGVSMGFDFSQNRVRAFQSYKNLGFHRKEESPVERVKEHLFNYQPNSIYSVWARNDLESAVNYSQSYSWSCPYVFELIIEVFASLKGRTIIMPFFYWFRSRENPPITTDDIDRSIDYITWTKEYPTEFKMYISVIGEMVRQYTFLSEQESVRVAYSIHKSFMAFLENYKSIRIERKRNQSKYKRFMRKLMRSISKRITPFHIIEKLLKGNAELSAEEYLQKLELEGVDVPWNEANRINKIITEFQRGR